MVIIYVIILDYLDDFGGYVMAERVCGTVNKVTCVTCMTNYKVKQTSYNFYHTSYRVY